MGQLSHSIMLEEYPMSENSFVQEDETHWIFTIEVVSYLGIGRFVLGLFSDIAVLGDDGFKLYLTEAISNMNL